MPEELNVPIRSEADLVTARLRGRELAAALHFSSSELTLIATAISEVTRNILSYAGSGELDLRHVRRGQLEGVAIIARDRGPGIADLFAAMQDGFSTSGGLGLGLPGSKRLMDEFDVASEVGKGTTVTMTKWKM
ncbi:anti-sigma regulatory factor [Dechloromonas sp. XY25]|uniref:Anti-sigma regulatory factor n=1 Tax=Dechloromonas hankyongensis TaxID=2908002 RepID=A0ABS9JYU0_9RHOO|nr:anti-sigma regulatory factor [Dechloromonas hankyongensis]MCG2576071.1 anti-sigma regulatory factor [Dechloromonas hankyongensis]